MQRAAGCGPEDLTLIDYQYGTWVYAESEDLQHARDLIDDSLKVCSTCTNGFVLSDIQKIVPTNLE